MFVQAAGRTRFQSHIALLLAAIAKLRMLLIQRMEWYGTAASFQDLLDRAYSDFQTYCKTHHLPQSQPRFTPGLDPWLIQKHSIQVVIF